MKNGILAVVVAILILGGVAAGYLVGSTSEKTTTSTTTTTKYLTVQGSQPYLNVSPVYSNLGYPKITYNGISRYVSPEPNYTFTYHTPSVYTRVGNVTAPVIDLSRAVELAAQALGLSPSNYTLAQADFVPGDIMNSTVESPGWYLFFARSYDGYWTFGSCGTGAFSAFAIADALKGTASKSNDSYCSGAGFPVSGRFELKATSSEALRQVRAANLSGVPAALEENGNVYSIEPRIVRFGPSSDNIAFQNPLNASYSGTTRLCWVVQLNSPTPSWGYNGIFAVDAGTGALVSGWAQALYPNSHISYLTGSPIFSSATNLNVTTETFLIDGGLVGVSGLVPVVVPNVVIAKPGSAGTLALNFSSIYGSDANATLSFVNLLPGFQTYLPNNLPSGVTIQPPTRSVHVPGNGQTRVNLAISVDQSAPTGTYLICLRASFPQGWADAFFFLSVWNGKGHWPPPPNPK